MSKTDDSTNKDQDHGCPCGSMETSGVTQQQFCAEHDLKVSTFAYWVAKQKRAGSGESAGGFIKIDVSGPAGPDPVCITYPNGVRIALSSANLPLISQLIRLASCSP